MRKRRALIYKPERPLYHLTILEAASSGLKKIGIESDYSEIGAVPEKLDRYGLAVFYGARPPIPEIIAALKYHRIRSLILEAGHLKRVTLETWPEGFYQLSLDRLNWIPPARTCPGDRFEALQIDRATEKRIDRGDKILVLGQTIGDASHNLGLREMSTWIKNMLKRIQVYTDREIVFRPHPKVFKGLIGGPIVRPSGVNFSDSRKNKLEQDLKKAWAAVTFCSTAGQTVLLKGIPLFCDSSTIYAEISNLLIDNIEKPAWFDTEDYFNRLAFCQWTFDELVSGEPFDFIKQFLKIK